MVDGQGTLYWYSGGPTILPVDDAKTGATEKQKPTDDKNVNAGQMPSSKIIVFFFFKFSCFHCAKIVFFPTLQLGAQSRAFSPFCVIRVVSVIFSSVICASSFMIFDVLF